MRKDSEKERGCIGEEQTGMDLELLEAGIPWKLGYRSQAKAEGLPIEL